MLKANAGDLRNQTFGIRTQVRNIFLCTFCTALLADPVLSVNFCHEAGREGTAAELLSTTLLKFEAGAARARRIPAGHNMPAVDIIPGFIEAYRAGTFVNKAVASLSLVVKTGDKFHIALTGILAVGAVTPAARANWWRENRRSLIPYARLRLVGAWWQSNNPYSSTTKAL